MQTVLLPGALVPSEVADELTWRIPARLAAVVSQARVTGERSAHVSAAGAAHLDWLAGAVFCSPPPAPSAPYAWAALQQAPETAMLWHAEPAHIAASRDGLYMQPLDEPLAGAHADALISAANDALSGTDVHLQRCGPHWFVVAADRWQIETPPLAGQVRPLVAARSQDETRWMRLHNAVQMSWHEHPVNIQREADGALPVGGIWLHGGGVWRPLNHAFASIEADDPALQGAAMAASGSGRHRLVVYDEALAPRQQHDWAAWITAMGTVDERLTTLPDLQTLVLTGNFLVRVLQYRRLDSLKFWQHGAASLRLAESEQA